MVLHVVSNRNQWMVNWSYQHHHIISCARRKYAMKFYQSAMLVTQCHVRIMQNVYHYHNATTNANVSLVIMDVIVNIWLMLVMEIHAVTMQHVLLWRRDVSVVNVNLDTRAHDVKLILTIVWITNVKTMQRVLMECSHTHATANLASAVSFYSLIFKLFE